MTHARVCLGNILLCLPKEELRKCTRRRMRVSSSNKLKWVQYKTGILHSFHFNSPLEAHPKAGKGG